MTANDTATRRVTTGIVLAVGLFAGGDSYSHIYTLARDHGQAIASAALMLPRTRPLGPTTTSPVTLTSPSTRPKISSEPRDPGVRLVERGAARSLTRVDRGVRERGDADQHDLVSDRSVDGVELRLRCVLRHEDRRR